MQRCENASYQHARQSCYLCLQPHNGVDTEIQIEYEGVLFICKGCCKSLAETAGLRVDEDRSEEVAKLQAELDESRQAQIDAETLLIQLERQAKDFQQKRMARVREAKKAKVEA